MSNIMMKLQLIILIYVITTCYAVRPQIGFYTQPNCTGDGLLLESKRPDMTSFRPSIVSNQKSWSVMGVWGIYKGVNYSHSDPLDSIAYGDEVRICINSFKVNLTKSVRYLGPPDTTNHSISLYEATYLMGTEVTITGPASSNIPFIPRSLFSTGDTSWTLYSGSDFDGEAFCFIPDDEPYDYIYDLSSTVSIVKSILRGCNSHVDHYIYGSHEPKDILISKQHQ